MLLCVRCATDNAQAARRIYDWIDLPMRAYSKKNRREDPFVTKRKVQGKQDKERQDRFG